MKIGDSIRVTTDISAQDVSLLKRSKAENFTKKLTDIKQKGHISRAEFKELAKSVTGGKEALSDFLVKNNIVPQSDIETLTKSKFFAIASRAKVNINASSLSLRIISQNQQKEEVRIPVQGGLTVPPDTEILDGSTKLGIRTPIKKAFTVRDAEGKSQAFNKDDEVMVHRVGEETFITRLAGGKAAGGKIKIDDLSVLGKALQTFEKTDAPLFPEGISTDHIHQGAIGDCYLIASIYKLAAQDPEALANMIKDNGDGTVTLRFFNRDEEGVKPVFINIEKSTLTTSQHATDSLWVQMIEKGYATFRSSYENLEGGEMTDAFLAMTGKTSTSTSFQNTSLEDLKLKTFKPFDFGKIDDLKAAARGMGIAEEKLSILDELALIPNDSNHERDVNHKIRELGVGGANFTTLKRMLQNPEYGKISDIMRAIANDKTSPYQKIISSSTASQAEIDSLIRELKTIYREDPLAVTVLEKLGAVTENQFMSTKTVSDGSSRIVYSTGQQQLFSQIETALSQRKFVGMGSTKTIKGIVDGTGKSAGEPIVAGIAGGHFYAVLDVVEMDGRKFVKIANPWGSTESRDYTVDEHGTLTAKSFDADDYSYIGDIHRDEHSGQRIQDNESWVELSDFSTFADTLVVENS